MRLREHHHNGRSMEESVITGCLLDFDVLYAFESKGGNHAFSLLFWPARYSVLVLRLMDIVS